MVLLCSAECKTKIGVIHSWVGRNVHSACGGTLNVIARVKFPGLEKVQQVVFRLVQACANGF